jgi:hypothetical protein
MTAKIRTQILVTARRIGLPLTQQLQVRVGSSSTSAGFVKAPGMFCSIVCSTSGFDLGPMRLVVLLTTEPFFTKRLTIQ